MIAKKHVDGYFRYLEYIKYADKLEKLSVVLKNRVRKDFESKQGQMRVIDVGAGSGRLAAAILQQASESGADCSIACVEKSHDAAHALHLRFTGDARVAVIEGEFPHCMPLDGNRADVVLAAHVMYYFHDVRNFIDSCMNVSHAGGSIIFVAASMAVVENEIYKRMLPLFLADSSLDRTLDVDGRFGFAEEIQLTLLSMGILPEVEVISSNILIPHPVVESALRSFHKGDATRSSLIRVFAFLWRYTEKSLVTRRREWIEVLSEIVTAGAGLRLKYDDKVIVCSVNQQIGVVI